MVPQTKIRVKAKARKKRSSRIFSPFSRKPNQLLDQAIKLTHKFNLGTKLFAKVQSL